MFINDNTFYGKNNYENKLRQELFKKKIIKDKKLTYINVIKIFKKISNKEEIINKIKLNINVFR